jgi:hypothetical protein
MSMSNSNKGFYVGLCIAAFVIGAVVLGALGTANNQSSDQPPTATPSPIQPTTTPTPTLAPTQTPTHNSTPTTNPTNTPQPSVNPSSSPSLSPSPTPTPKATAFQNTTLTYGQVIDQVPTWVVNGTLVDTVANQGISGLTVTVVDSSNSSRVYGTATTGADGYFECTFAVMQPPTVQLVFAGTNQYQAVTSDVIELPLA